MGKTYEAISDDMATWLEAQPVFFVATAPLAADGHVNLSPKGMGGGLRVLGPRTVAYLDYFGSGVETIAHLREPGNGRITLMCCAFAGRPSIVRLQGHGRYVRPGEDGFEQLRAEFPKAETAGQRAVIVVEAERISDSCGYAVPLMTHVADRDVLDRHHARQDPDRYRVYAQTKNAYSIDGLPGLVRD